MGVMKLRRNLGHRSETVTKGDQHKTEGDRAMCVFHTKVLAQRRKYPAYCASLKLGAKRDLKQLFLEEIYSLWGCTRLGDQLGIN